MVHRILSIGTVLLLLCTVACSSDKNTSTGDNPDDGTPDAGVPTNTVGDLDATVGVDGAPIGEDATAVIDPEPCTDTGTDATSMR